MSGGRVVQAQPAQSSLAGPRPFRAVGRMSSCSGGLAPVPQAIDYSRKALTLLRQKSVMNGMHSMMASMGSMMGFMYVVCLLVIVALVLGIAALLKFLRK
jgi:hypothetical protein